MQSIEQAVQAQSEAKAARPTTPTAAVATPAGPTAQAPAAAPWWARLYRVPALKTPLSEFQGHVLNLDGSLEVAQVLRGLTALGGTLDLAMLDVIGGLARWGWRLIRRA